MGVWHKYLCELKPFLPLRFTIFGYKRIARGAGMSSLPDLFIGIIIVIIVVVIVILGITITIVIVIVIIVIIVIVIFVMMTKVEYGAVGRYGNVIVIVIVIIVIVIIIITECDEYIRIFEYIGHKYLFGHSFVSIFLLRIYSDIRSCQICLYEYIRTFVGECVRV